MGRKQRPPIEREAGGYRFNLDHEERDLVHRLMGEMRALLEAPPDDDEVDNRLKRIFPTAYHQPDDAALDIEYQRLMREEILTSRLKGLDAVDEFMRAASGDRASATEAQMMAFLQALNGIRLVLGTMLDVDERHDLGDVAEDDPRAGEYNLYDFLSWLLDWSVRAVQS
jgi:hypothetical protein